MGPVIGVAPVNGVLAKSHHPLTGLSTKPYGKSAAEQRFLQEAAKKISRAMRRMHGGDGLMRLCLYDDNRLGLVEGYTLRDVTRATAKLPQLRWPFPHGDQLIASLDKMKHAIKDAAEASPRKLITEVKLLSPVANPPRIIGAPLNYKLHVDEAADPAINHGVQLANFDGFATPIDKHGLFLKSQTGAVGPSEGIEIKFPGRRNDHEIELAVIIGRGGKNIPRDYAFDHIAAYTIGLDMTVRGTEDRSFRKSADGYSVLGPWLVTADEITNPGNLSMYIAVNGEVRQSANTRDMIVPIPDLIARLSNVYALHPGDVIMTGTPEGVSEIQPGDTIIATIEHIGAMEVKVR
jgi:2-keto-4-pentenoate hydratase/2-oxohepta-3-ene-1,7-dioic acid hydratase in catechol pathway